MEVFKLSERQQGAHAALTVMATRCDRYVDRYNMATVAHGMSSVYAQLNKAAITALRDVAEAIRIEAMLPPEMVPDVLRADYQPVSEKMDAAKVPP